MDLSTSHFGPSASLPTNRKRKAKNPATGKSKKAKFFATYVHQSFSLPDSIMKYIAKNPPSLKVYQKLVESCKYIFVTNPVLVVSRLINYGDHWLVNNGRKPFDLNKVNCKFWITFELHVGPKDLKSEKSIDETIVTSVIPKLYRCDAGYVDLTNQIIPSGDLAFLISAAEHISFRKVVFKQENGSNVAVENILQAAVKAKAVTLWDPTVTSKTMEELIKIPCFSKLDSFTMFNIPEVFDLKAFYAYMKTNKRTKFWLGFDNAISRAYKKQIEVIVGEIIAKKVFDFKPPFLGFAGFSQKKLKSLDRIHSSH